MHRDHALALLLLLAACGSTAPKSEADDAADVAVRDGQHALQILMAGNSRFVAGTPRHGHQSLARRASLAGRQKPFAVVLGCADSRVAPELLFDIGLGDLFVIRVAGNVAGDDESGSIEYAVAHLGTPLIVVLGHEGCGAVTAVVAPPHGEEAKELAHLLAAVRAGVGSVDASKPPQQCVHEGVEANVRHQVERLHAIQERFRQPRELRPLVVGGVYELDSGRVRILEPR